MFEAYAVSVRVSLINGVSAGLIAMARQFRSTSMGAAALRREITGIQKMTMAGGALAAVGGAGLWAAWKTVEPAKEYVHQLQLMNVAGMTHLEIMRSIRAAWDTSTGPVPTSSATENLQAIRELRMVFRGNTDEAVGNLATIQRLQAVLGSVKGVSSAHDEAYTLAKALELKGAVKNPAMFGHQADMMTQAIIASGGKVTATDFLRNFIYGRSATGFWNDDFAYRILPTLMQEMGGGRGGASGPGNALMSAYAAIVNGSIAKKALPEWQRLGLLDPSKIVRDKIGNTQGVQPGGIVGAAAFQANPFDWAQQYLVPALQKAGITDPTKQGAEIGYMFQNRTAGFIMQQLAIQAWKFLGDKALIAKAFDNKDAYNALLKRDPEMQQLAVATQWKNLMTQVGLQVIPLLTSALKTILPMLEAANKWAFAHPERMKALVTAFVALSGALAFSGVVLLLGGAFRSIWLVLKVFNVIKWASMASGLLGTGGALTALSLVRFGLIAAGIYLLVTNLPKLIGALSQVPGVIEGRLEADADTDFVAKKARETMRRHHLDGSSPGTSPYVAAGGGRPVVVATTVNIDGKKVAQAVNNHNVRAANGPSSGVSSFDSRQSFAPSTVPAR